MNLLNRLGKLSATGATPVEGPFIVAYLRALFGALGGRGR